MKKSELIIELTKTMNMGNNGSCNYPRDRVRWASEQVAFMVEVGDIEINKETGEITFK